MNNHYTYAYLREDGTPYYIGRGVKRRAFREHGKHISVPPAERILFLKTDLTFAESVRHEIYMISIFGRKDNNTGILRNLTNGGEGMEGYIVPEETRKKLSLAGKKRRLTPEHKARISETSRNLPKEVKLRKVASKRGKPLSEETKAKISETKRRNNELRRLGLL
jgi:hypothetical protein